MVMRDNRADLLRHQAQLRSLIVMQKEIAALANQVTEELVEAERQITEQLNALSEQESAKDV